ncbi:MAG: hypothetical protein N3A59_02785 [Thermodesulfovibrionales bacterium]|nr:hypothetical protein [Thermodesulfovibrionales bacterium]
MQIINLRGLKHPQHIQKFKEHFLGCCTIHEDIILLLDEEREDLKKFEIFLHSCRANYTLEQDDNSIKIIVLQPFSFCG